MGVDLIMNLSNQKGRAWAFVMYPESMPTNFYELLEQTGLPFAISPLHDKDLDPTGEPKKPHYHVMCYYENTTTKKNVKENVCDFSNLKAINKTSISIIILIFIWVI